MDVPSTGPLLDGAGAALDAVRSEWIELRQTAKVLRRLPRLMPWSRQSPAAYLRAQAAARPQGPAIVFEGRTTTWAEWDATADRVAAWLQQRGIGAGDTVALMLDNRPAFLELLLGLNRIGAAGALINTGLTGPALVHAIAVAKPRWLIVGSEHQDQVAPILAELPELDPASDCWVAVEGRAKAKIGQALEPALPAGAPHPVEHHRPRGSDVFAYIYTSGTTGLPKAALVTNQRMLLVSHGFGEALLEADDRDLIYVTLPLYHSSAMFVGVGTALVSGAGIALRRKFSASQFWPEIRALGATAFVYIGELCRYLQHAPADPEERRHRIRVAVGNGLRPDVWADFQQRFDVPRIVEFYGSTEGNVATVNLEGRPGMIGRMRPGALVIRCDPTSGEPIRDAQGRCQPVGVGERGLLVGRINRLARFDGYLDETATGKKILTDVRRRGDAYFNSGDVVQRHPLRWLSFVDRAGDTFRWKGENISTLEVAEILTMAPGVREANVYGVAIEGHDGRAGMAALVVGDDFDLKALATHAMANLTRTQRPYFLRLLRSGMQQTGTFKQRKVDYRREGFDPTQIEDPLYFFDGARFVPLDAALYERIRRGEQVV